MQMHSENQYSSQNHFISMGIKLSQGLQRRKTCTFLLLCQFLLLLSCIHQCFNCGPLCYTLYRDKTNSLCQDPPFVQSSLLSGGEGFPKKVFQNLVSPSVASASGEQNKELPVQRGNVVHVPSKQHLP